MLLPSQEVESGLVALIKSILPRLCYMWGNTLFMPFLPYLHRVSSRHGLEVSEAHDAMSLILEGSVSTAQIAAFLVALRMKGETAAELLGFAQAMRERAQPIEHGLNGTMILDTCGTGGDAHSTFNISTVAAFVTAGVGVRVAKHGNRSISSHCGSADVLEELGVRVSVPAERVAAAIREVGIGFLFAPSLHPAMKHAQPARLELKMRTVFNLLGPLTNPAKANAQLIGAPSEEAAGLMAHALAGLGTGRAFVVHGFDGLDEITTTGPTLVYEVRGDSVSKHVWTPADFGIQRSGMDELQSATRTDSAAIARDILNGRLGPKRDIVLMNSAAALVAASRAADLREGVSLAAAAIDTGAAAEKLAALAAHSLADSRP
jgi:anthranilate phosphoribosyltransferase